MNQPVRKHKNILQLLSLLTAVLLGAIYAPRANALPTSHYATNSLLAEGRWVTVKTSGTGMHFVSDATLRNLGFTDPKKVHVFGNGGQMEPEALTTRMGDDLPLVPSEHNGKGIVFFARDQYYWVKGSSTTSHVRPYTHEINPYSEECVYFLSDRELPAEARYTLPQLNMKGTSSSVITGFTARTVYEKDIEPLGNSGRNYVGEDFRATKQQTFNFSLPGNQGGEVKLYTQFAAKVTGGNSTLKFTVNGNAIDSNNSYTIGGCGSDYYATVSNFSNIVKCSDNKLAFGINYSYSGVLFSARLDYIEAFYERKLQLTDGELHFYGTFRSGDLLKIEGCDATTIIWEVTTPGQAKKIDFTLQGSTAQLLVNDLGYREFVAFNPSSVSKSVTPGSNIANQNLHALEAPEMLIISPATYMEGAKMIADYHSTATDSLSVIILTPEAIYNEFSGGTPDVSAFRKLLKMWHDRGGAPKYCLLMGKPSFDQKMLTSDLKRANYTPTPIWQSPTGLHEHYSYSNDDYIGMLDDVEAENFFISQAKIHVAVGRLPVTDATESKTVAQKIVDYSTSPTLGAWRNKVMLIADDSDNSSHFTQSQTVYKNLYNSSSAFLYDRLYLDSYPLVYTAVGATYPQATERMLRNYNEGVVFTSYIGHASEMGWGHEHLWTWEKIEGMNNPNLTFIYAATCRFTPWDEHGDNGGMNLLLNPNGGIVGMICASRTVYIEGNGKFSNHLSQRLFSTDSEGKLNRIGDSYLYAKNAIGSDSNKLRYIFMGDPAMRFNFIDRTVNIEAINGEEITGADSLPEIKGGEQMKVSGTVTTTRGETDTEFNGTVSLLLYDAESVIETYGNGENGVVETYNDRKTRLSAVNASVKQGVWSATINVPMEISNNYMPALISAYAWSDTGKEAHGACEDFLLFGYSDEVVTDTIGPEIDKIYLNTTDFKDGGVVNTNPILFAHLTDPSGINLSEGGVGHRLMISVDQSTLYNDVSQYFTPDNDDNGGTIAYPLTDITPGNHTLTLEAWDNLNNCTRKSLNFAVNATADPYIVNLHTDVNPATSGVNFILNLDQPNTKMKLDIEVFDLNGRVVWSNEVRQLTDSGAKMTTYWNLCNKNGVRVPRGIYLYRARVETPQGTYSSKTNRLAVTAQ